MSLTQRLSRPLPVSARPADDDDGIVKAMRPVPITQMQRGRINLPTTALTKLSLARFIGALIDVAPHVLVTIVGVERLLIDWWFYLASEGALPASRAVVREEVIKAKMTGGRKPRVLRRTAVGRVGGRRGDMQCVGGTML
ncbi:hypothetical protein L202_03258 [Cryptococcus amylolentus CBS 6039]|uniref:Uncharacterized protein n=2 Tax=Cryptococcus amylolentus TaxID=104669 RepID=A0A1E3HY34_9TREE|nr:hypothetical protein L202_03258 [Cryptococcus amylolentus CBS 6039]ODN81167.1 hypothetical protein L202_03258 [Cryptococcus amylolentus CBS 6039]ODO09615.1 hypothetical protein I350_03223 [Cryptococcus amylolentus CBS 6273]